MEQEKETNDSKGLVKSSAVVGGMTFISRISGFLRDVVFANIFGASAHTDAFFISFKIPNFFRRLFAEGALIQAFVPILNDIKENDRDNLKRFISYMQGNLALILILIVTLGIIFSETVINIFAPESSILSFTGSGPNAENNGPTIAPIFNPPNTEI